MDRLNLHIADVVLPESLGLEMVGALMIYFHLQKKSIEQYIDLYQVFIDLTKAFDSVNSCALGDLKAVLP